MAQWRSVIESPVRDHNKAKRSTMRAPGDTRPWWGRGGRIVQTEDDMMNAGRQAILALLALACAPAGLAQATSAAADLHAAARSGDLALLQAGLKQGANPNARDKQGRTPLMDAAAEAQVAAMRLLIASGADVNAAAHDGQTPLMAAAAAGALDAARLLVQSRADLNLASRGWGTALKTAERTGHNDIAAMLLRAGARSTGSSVGDTVCVRSWGGDGYCGTVEAIDKTQYRLRVTKLVGCQNGCPARADCSGGRTVGGSEGIAVGDEVSTTSWCLTHTGVQP
jgi:hypothetical protein